MKVALVHEWLTNLAGSERVLLAMHELYPEAPIYTSLYAPERLPAEYGPDRLDVRTSRLQQLPGATSKWRQLLPLMPAAFESFDLTGFDLVLSSSHACAKGVLTPTETCHVCYCYTPTRYLWEFPRAYLRDLPVWARPIFAVVQHWLRPWDYAAAQRPDQFIAISETVRRRIAKHYRRESEVVYPPVETSRFTPAAHRDDFYLVVSRLVGYKRVELAAAACTELGLPLKIVGVGPEEQRIRACAGPTVEFLGWRSDDEVAELLGCAKALVFPGVEDFGLVPVEAQAAGCPVIALREGGATETVMDGETGVFFNQPTVADVVAAVRRLDALSLDPAALLANARRFDRSVFAQQLAAALDRAMRAHCEGLEVAR